MRPYAVERRLQHDLPPSKLRQHALCSDSLLAGPGCVLDNYITANLCIEHTICFAVREFEARFLDS
jgi:hypothetical protein